MRKVEAGMVMAIRELIGKADHDGSYWRSGNTEVSQHHHGVRGEAGYQRIISVRLFGNEIAAFRPGVERLWVSDCGWRSATTKSRLNVLLSVFTWSGGISQARWQWYLDSEEWDGSAVLAYAVRDCWQMQQAERLTAPRQKGRTYSADDHKRLAALLAEAKPKGWQAVMA